MRTAAYNGYAQNRDKKDVSKPEKGFDTSLSFAL